jgi:hypothetical protein
MPSSCFSKALQSPAKQNGNAVKIKKTESDGLMEKFIIDNPLIFRICCFCIVRSRKRVDTTEKTNGHANHIQRNSDDTVLTIEQIEFTKSPTITLQSSDEK